MRDGCGSLTITFQLAHLPVLTIFLFRRVLGLAFSGAGSFGAGDALAAVLGDGRYFGWGERGVFCGSKDQSFGCLLIHGILNKALLVVRLVLFALDWLVALGFDAEHDQVVEAGRLVDLVD